jgi:hypothetical protein
MGFPFSKKEKVYEQEQVSKRDKRKRTSVRDCQLSERFKQ